MPSIEPERCLTLLDVGHGSSAVLRDEGGIVIFDAGPGDYLSRYLDKEKSSEIESLFLSHSDSDHIGGAVTLLMNQAVTVRKVLLNPDGTKNSVTFEQLRYALSEAALRAGTLVEPSLTTSTKIARNGAGIEIVFPTAVDAIAGVGGRDLQGRALNSNSLSAAIIVTGAPDAAVLLCGDIESNCIEEWTRTTRKVSAQAMVFPHHGGTPGESDPSKIHAFAEAITRTVSPSWVLFSIHRSRFNLPRDEVIAGILAVDANTKLVCTQIPDRLRSSVHASTNWSLHVDRGSGRVREGNIRIRFAPGHIELTFC